ncbi:site-specific integrase [Aestuariibacter salexigens]|uniref:site-specific integrase n=1 Tax=Aestuariibacter salexigens TaxID=226010 RepID=UPI00041AD798|nr:site-specific integrase [Aestuariibacter salexigens]
MSVNKKTDSESLLGGKGEIYRMTRSGSVYQCRIWIPDERKYLRRSLKTSDYETAKLRGEELIFKTYSDVKSGRKLFGINLGELVEKYLAWRERDVGVEGGITKARHGTIKSQCKALLRVKSPTTKISELDENSFYDWRQMRLKDNPSISLVTIRNETATIAQLFDFAYRNGFSHIPKLFFRPTKMSRYEISRRDTFEIDEYDAMVKFLRSYTSKKHCPDDEERLERKKIRDYILILANTLLRTGELRQLTYGDVLEFDDRVDANGLKVCLVKLRVRKETSKVRSGRTIWVRGGDYIKRLKSYSPFTDDHDLLFTNKSGTHPLGTRELYKHWDVIMKAIGIPDHRQRKLSYYSLRHFGITMRMKSEVPIADVAAIAGTSVAYIETHYRHIDDEVMYRSALKNFSKVDESAKQLK